MIKNIAILGSTGSIGRNALKVIDALGIDYNVTALTAHSKTELLAEQCRHFNPDYIGITNNQYAGELSELLTDYQGQILTGPDSMVEIASLDNVDIVITAVVGAAGLPAVLAAAEKGKILAIANKEPLVIAGKLLTETAHRNNATILPIDSEHSAVFQALQAGQPDEVNKIILTASGGPFRGATSDMIQNATLDDALNHPTWNMGPKITIDSATMMNKALEIIEAVWLFKVPVDKIEVLIHPESIVHSMVEFVDGSIVAQLGTPDMCIPIQYALTYPKRVKGITNHLKLNELGKLTFETPDMNVFRALSLGYEAAKQDGSAPVIFNAANEAAVEAFLDKKIRFADIIGLIEHCLNKYNHKSSLELDELLEADTWARKEVSECMKMRTQ